MSSMALAPGVEGSNAGVSLNQTALEEAAERLNITRVVATAKFGFNLPLIFDDLQQEVNFWAVTILLSFGSGWHEAKPHKYGPSGYPHRDTVTYGLVGLHMGGHSLDASDLAGLQPFALGQAFNIPITKEHRIDGGPIRQDVPSDYRPLIDMYTSVLNRVGVELMARGFKSLGDFVLSVSVQGHSRPADPPPPSAFSASLLVHRLVNVFAELRDEAEGVTFHRKSQLIALELSLRFRHRDERLNFNDLSSLTLGADAETGVWMREKGALQLSPELAEKVDSCVPLAHGSKAEVALRLGAARCTLLLAQRLSALHPDHAVSCADVSRFMDYISKIRHRWHVKHFEATEKKNSEAEPKISEITDDNDATMAEEGDEVGLQQVLFVCKDSAHY